MNTQFINHTYQNVRIANEPIHQLILILPITIFLTLHSKLNDINYF